MDSTIMTTPKSLDGTDRAILVRSVRTCPDCQTRPVAEYRGSLQPYCLECHRHHKRKWKQRSVERSTQERSTKGRPKRCEACGQSLPHGGGCPETIRTNLAKRGRKILNDQWPGYGELVEEAVLQRVGKDWPHVRLPLASFVFPGLSKRLDHRLQQEKRDKDVS